MHPRLLAIARDAKPGVILTTASILPRIEALVHRLPELEAAHSLATDPPRACGRGPSRSG